jgi:AbrB family looped-hinge helix DNA binding protein
MKGVDMPKKTIDSEALIRMISDKVPQNEIMAKFGFKTSTQLKVAYANALMETGQAPALKSGRGKNANDVDPTVKVGKRGSIVIPKNLVELFGFKENDSFEIRKSAAGLSLKKKDG